MGVPPRSETRLILATYTLNPERRTLHGHFSRDLPPILTVESGDTVVYRTLEAGWGLEPYAPGRYAPRQSEFEGRVAGLDDGHALIGPIAVRGAQPGKMLAIHIEDVQPGAWGACLAGGWKGAFNQTFAIAEEMGVVHAWTLDAATMTGRNHLGHTIALHPFMGVMGMPPDEPGIHPTAPPRMTGGNLDCKALVAGSTLYLPIAVEGGLFSVGDGHAAQGDGEVSGTAIECPMDRVVLTFEVRDDLPLNTPFANTPEGWLTMGFHENLNEATVMALEAMFTLTQSQFQLSRLDAIALASVVVDVRVTQIANGVLGVHALLPHRAVQTE